MLRLIALVLFAQLLLLGWAGVSVAASTMAASSSSQSFPLPTVNPIDSGLVNGQITDGLVSLLAEVPFELSDALSSVYVVNSVDKRAAPYQIIALKVPLALAPNGFRRVTRLACLYS